MSPAPSFERLDYLLRTNKHVERKLVFDVLTAASQRFDFSDHWYLGFGSMWFGDFKLAHRRLGIGDMVSIEREAHSERANYNRPFANVVVKPGDCNAVLTAIEGATWSKPVVAWLDYDGHLDDDVVSDMKLLLDRASFNSAIIITVNAARMTYRVRKPDGVLTRNETAVGMVARFLGNRSIPVRFEPQPNEAGAFVDVKEGLFPEFLTEALATFMEHHVISTARQINGERVRFVPLYRLHHRDGADMVSVGGVICRESDEQSWRECLKKSPLLVDGDDRAAYCKLDLIPLTVKEKIALDECLPNGTAERDFLAAAKASGIALKDSEIEKYRKFYRHFPVFVETTI